ncbi:MAG: hypothetical protein AAFZ99_11930 [Pseudomonadota bacterium]
MVKETRNQKTGSRSKSKMAAVGQFVALNIILAGAVQAQTSSIPRIDAARWIEGCDALTQDTHYASIMDQACFSVAWDYCSVGGGGPGAAQCLEGLRQWFEDASDLLVLQAPCEAKEQTYIRDLLLPELLEPENCPDVVVEGVPETTVCEAAVWGSQWLRLRDVVRRANSKG